MVIIALESGTEDQDFRFVLPFSWTSTGSAMTMSIAAGYNYQW